MVDHLSRQKVFNIVINHYDDNTNIVLLSDISDTVIESDRLREKAQHDALTGCYNREYLYDSFDAIIEQRAKDRSRADFDGYRPF
ncbi:MAG: hypothetical protein IE916_07355 [Epsilonproteobacteria bacterium]|nr:hypothetical protein [Campylobacterota bacterium]